MVPFLLTSLALLVNRDLADRLLGLAPSLMLGYALDLVEHLEMAHLVSQSSASLAYTNDCIAACAFADAVRVVFSTVFAGLFD